VTTDFTFEDNAPNTWGTCFYRCPKNLQVEDSGHEGKALKTPEWISFWLGENDKNTFEVKTGQKVIVSVWHKKCTNHEARWSVVWNPRSTHQFHNDNKGANFYGDTSWKQQTVVLKESDGGVVREGQRIGFQIDRSNAVCFDNVQVCVKDADDADETCPSAAGPTLVHDGRCAGDHKWFGNVGSQENCISQTLAWSECLIQGSTDFAYMNYGTNDDKCSCCKYVIADVNAIDYHDVGYYGMYRVEPGA